METPLIDHLTCKDLDHVYEPAEDSFLLLDALEKDLDYLKKLDPKICLEIGSGSGIIITALSKSFKNSLCFATDINPFACETTIRTAKRNNVKVESIRCNLADSIKANTIDLLVFNPPYVVTTDEEMSKQKFPSHQHNSNIIGNNLVSSWAGGQFGRRIIDQLLLKLETILSPKGVFYLLLLRENKPNEIVKQLLQMGFESTKFMERRIPGEYLYIIKSYRKN